MGFLSVHFDEHGIAVAYRTSMDNDVPKPKVQLCEYIPCATKEEFPAKLKNFVHQNNLQHVLVNFVLEPGKYRLIYIDSPKVPEEELANAARYLVKDLITFPLNEAVVDAFVMPVRPGQKEKIHVVVAELKVIENVIKVVEAAGLKVNSIDIPELSLANFLTLLERQNKSDAPAASAEVIQPTAAAPSTEGLMAAATPADTATPATGGLMSPAPTDTSQPASPAMASSKDKETGLLLLQPNYAEIAVNRENLLCLARDVETVLSYTDSDEAAPDAETMDRVSKEIERSISYYQSHLSRGQMQDFWVLSMLQGQETLINALQGMLSADVKPLDLNEKLSFNKPLERIEQARCLIALGGVLRDLEVDA